MVTNSLIDAKEAGWWAYARPEGYVVRGKYVAGDGRVYLANNDGKLESPGWLVTGAYDGGGLQRYYIDEATRAARTGFFQVGPESYLSLSGRGYVLRGTTRLGDQYYRADNDGMLVLSFLSSVDTGEGMPPRACSPPSWETRPTSSSRPTLTSARCHSASGHSTGARAS